MPTLPDSALTPQILLGLITLAPIFVAWALGLFASKPEKKGVITTGNPLRAHGEVFEHDPVHESVLHLSRTENADELRGLALGLRHSPVAVAAPLLKHFMQSADPELALFSQSILQQGREKLQSTLNQLQNHHEPHDPRVAASLLETSLQLASPTLTAPGERDGRVQQIARKAGELLAACAHTPRLLAVCARVFLAAGDSEKAGSLVRSMPGDSELRRTLEPQVRFAQHIKNSAAAI